LDGESPQMQAFLEESTLNMLKQQQIVVGKLPASTTATYQPCDVGPIFRKSKQHTKFSNQVDQTSNPELAKKLLDIINTNCKKYQTKVAPAVRNRMVVGLLRAAQAVRCGLNPDSIRQSFEKAGIYSVQKRGISLDQMISQCKADIDIDMQVKIVSNVPKLAKIIEDTGELSDEAMTACGFEETYRKDNLSLIHRRSVVLTNHKFHQKECAKVQAKAKVQTPKRTRASKEPEPKSGVKLPKTTQTACV
jgi:hypothetical protein